MRPILHEDLMGLRRPPLFRGDARAALDIEFEQLLKKNTAAVQAMAPMVGGQQVIVLCDPSSIHWVRRSGVKILDDEVQIYVATPNHIIELLGSKHGIKQIKERLRVSEDEIAVVCMIAADTGFAVAYRHRNGWLVRPRNTRGL